LFLSRYSPRRDYLDVLTMTASDEQVSSRAVHRMLIKRIGVTGVLIALALGALVYAVEQRRFDEEIVDFTQRRVAQFAAYAETALGQPDVLRSGELQAALEAFVRGRLAPREGRIVAVRIYDASGKPAAHLELAEHAQRAEAVSFLDGLQPAADESDTAAARQVTLGGVAHVFAQLPLHGAQAQALGYVRVLFAPSDVYRAELRQRLWRTVGASIAVVLVTSLVLYPVIVRLMRRITTLSLNLLDANLETLQLLGSAIAKRDADTDVHNYRVTIYSVRLAETLGLDAKAIQRLIKGAFLHDVGKIGVPDDILLKPGRLDASEFGEMQKHVSHGLDIVQRSRWLADAAEVVGHHHEKFDGSGYHSKLQAEAIPAAARIFAVADVFDALTSRRPYKEPLDFDATMGVLEQGRGTHFDPRVLDAFGAIARGLYDEFGNRDDAHPRQVLAAIVDRYFKQDLASVLG
jgi:HD-GYP domain-containing protein (c-di-GMP phosphodiesterase class II)